MCVGSTLLTGCCCLLGQKHEDEEGRTIRELEDALSSQELPMETLRAQAHSSLLPKHSPSKWMLDGKKVRLTEGKHDLGMAETLLHEQRPKPRRRGTLLAKGKPEHRITPGGSFKSTEKAAKQGLQKHSPVPFLGQVNTQDSTEPQSMPGEQRPGH